MRTSLDGLGAELARFDGVYIGGGNTYYLLHALRQSGLDRNLASFARDDGPVYGGSAGAVVLGSDIGTVKEIDVNDVGLTDLTGLDLIGGQAVWVHYTPSQRVAVEDYAARHDRSLIVLTERAAVAYRGNVPVSVGLEPAFRVDSRGWANLSDE